MLASDGRPKGLTYVELRKLIQAISGGTVAAMGASLVLPSMRSRDLAGDAGPAAAIMKTWMPVRPSLPIHSNDEYAGAGFGGVHSGIRRTS